MEKKNNKIIEEEFNFVKVGSLHNTKRIKKIMSNMLENPGKSTLSQSSSRSEAKAAYQFFNNENFDLSDIQRVHRIRTDDRIAEAETPILIIQDTTYVNYNTQTKKEGLGNIFPNTKGVKIHSSIATTLEGLNLGILHQQSFSSDDTNEEEQLTKHQLQKRSIEEKESYRWIESFNESVRSMPDNLDITVISDREGDIYEYMNAVISKKRYFLTRIAQNRITVDNEKILDNIKKAESFGILSVKVPRNSKKSIEAREANLEIRHKKYEIKLPEMLKHNPNLPESLTVYVIHAKEINPPKNVEPLEWFLMTNRLISSADEAVQQLKNYVQRWKIERFHYVLKTGGCNIEKIQARSMDVALSLIMIYSIIAVFIMNMTYAARITPDAPCTDYFDEEEWQLLYTIINKTTKIPEKPISIKEAVRLLAELSSGKRSPSDGDPGVKLIWQGLEKLYCICQHQVQIYEFMAAKKLTVQV